MNKKVKKSFCDETLVEKLGVKAKKLIKDDTIVVYQLSDGNNFGCHTKKRMSFSLDYNLS